MSVAPGAPECSRTDEVRRLTPPLACGIQSKPFSAVLSWHARTSSARSRDISPVNSPHASLVSLATSMPLFIRYAVLCCAFRPLTYFPKKSIMLCLSET